jgi:hypothetical protein
MKLSVLLAMMMGLAVLVLPAQQKEVKKIPVTSTRADSAVDRLKRIARPVMELTRGATARRRTV